MILVPEALSTAWRIKNRFCISDTYSAWIVLQGKAGIPIDEEIFPFLCPPSAIICCSPLWRMQGLHFVIPCLTEARVSAPQTYPLPQSVTPWENLPASKGAEDWEAGEKCWTVKSLSLFIHPCSLIRYNLDFFSGGGGGQGKGVFVFLKQTT